MKIKTHEQLGYSQTKILIIYYVIHKYIAFTISEEKYQDKVQIVAFILYSVFLSYFKILLFDFTIKY